MPPILFPDFQVVIEPARLTFTFVNAAHKPVMGTSLHIQRASFDKIAAACKRTYATKVEGHAQPLGPLPYGIVDGILYAPEMQQAAGGVGVKDTTPLVVRISKGNVAFTIGYTRLLELEQLARQPQRAS